MKLKSKKKIAGLSLAMAICGTVMVGNIASADAIVSKGTREYNGIFTDQAFAWTGSNAVGFVRADVVKTSNYSPIVTSIDNDGWVQNPQTSYSSTSVMGLHASQNDSARSYP